MGGDFFIPDIPVWFATISLPSFHTQGLPNSSPALSFLWGFLSVSSAVWKALPSLICHLPFGHLWSSSFSTNRFKLLCLAIEGTGLLPPPPQAQVIALCSGPLQTLLLPSVAINRSITVVHLRSHQPLCFLKVGNDRTCLGPRSFMCAW